MSHPAAAAAAGAGLFGALSSMMSLNQHVTVYQTTLTLSVPHAAAASACAGSGLFGALSSMMGLKLYVAILTPYCFTLLLLLLLLLAQGLACLVR
jgi:hypothetical protein